MRILSEARELVIVAMHGERDLQLFDFDGRSLGKHSVAHAVTRLFMLSERIVVAEGDLVQLLVLE